MRSIDWAALESKAALPPFEPDSKKANFDATHELEELLLEDNPLKAKKRNPKNDVSLMSNEMRLMEETFRELRLAIWKSSILTCHRFSCLRPYSHVTEV
jgi:hypothetical protein